MLCTQNFNVLRWAFFASSLHVHERRQLLWNGLHIMTLHVCIYVVNMQTSLKSMLAFVHSDVKNAFSQSPQYMYTNMATATRTYPESYRKYTEQQVVNITTVWVCRVSIFMISRAVYRFVVHQHWKHLALWTDRAIQASYSQSASWRKLHTQHEVRQWCQCVQYLIVSIVYCYSTFMFCTCNCCVMATRPFWSFHTLPLAKTEKKNSIMVKQATQLRCMIFSISGVLLSRYLKWHIFYTRLLLKCRDSWII